MDIVVLAVLLGVVGCLSLGLVELVVRRTDFGAILILGLLLFSESFPDVSLSFIVGPVSVGPQDLLLALFAVASVARLLRAERLTNPQRLLIFISLLVFWALARGVGPFGLPAAVNEARRNLRFVVTALYFSTLEDRKDILERLGWLWVIASLALVLLTVVRWLANSVGVVGGAFGEGGNLRVIPADSALIIAQGAVLAFPLYAQRSRQLLRFLAPGFLVAVVILQHRTVWIAGAFGSVYLLFREQALAKRVLSALVVATILFSALVLTVFGGREDDVTDQLATSAQSTNTFEWRVDGWTALLAETVDAGPDEVVVGRPFGTGWSRRMPSGGVVEVSPHNYYVEAFLRIGALGLVLMALLYAAVLRGTSRASWANGFNSGPPMTASGLHVVIAMQLVYYITYAPDMAQAILLGIGLSVAGHAEGRRATSRRRYEAVT